jgi:hypothetical protein
VKKAHNISPKAIRDNFLLLLLSVTCLFAIGIGEYILFTKNQNLKTLKPPLSVAPLPANPLNEVVLTYPLAGEQISSPTTVSGTVPPGWMFEGVLPVKLVDSDGKLISTSLGREDIPGSWQSGNAVTFSATVNFTTDSKKGKLVIEKDNPSGLTENAASFEMPVIFKTDEGVACTMDAKICPDGTAVGRSGPNCEFTPCP